MSAEEAASVQWQLMDSGSSEVYLPQKFRVTNPVPVDEEDLVHTADGTVLPLEKGSWCCLWREHDGEWCEVEHANAVRMPNFERVLISVGRLIC